MITYCWWQQRETNNAKLISNNKPLTLILQLVSKTVKSREPMTTRHMFSSKGAIFEEED
jgi:hypothetical protein